MSDTKSTPNPLKDAALDVAKALGERMVSSATGRVSGLTERLQDIAAPGTSDKEDQGDQDQDQSEDQGGEGGSPVQGGMVSGVGEAMSAGTSPIMGGIKGAFSGIKEKVTGKKSGGGANKRPTNITDAYYIGLPVKDVYNQWTQYKEFPGFMKGPTSVSQEDDVTSNWKAKIFLNNRSWQAKVVDQVPDQRIKWRTTGPKGSIDGVVTFHEVADRLTLMILVLEYRPKGFFEWWGNRWRTVGRRYRLDVKHFRRYLMMNGEVVPQDGGWRGTIEDGEVTETHEDAVEREQQEQEQGDQPDQPEEPEAGDDGPDDAGPDAGGEQPAEEPVAPGDDQTPDDSGDTGGGTPETPNSPDTPDTPEGGGSEPDQPSDAGNDEPAKPEEDKSPTEDSNVPEDGKPEQQ